MIASLPMYDMPALHGANDRLWQATRAVLGFGPEALTRTPDLWAQWEAPDLVLSQTCGYPYRAKLHDKVQLVATPNFALKGCPYGTYNSVFLARRTDKITRLSELAGKRFAFNEALSQSGWAAPKVHLDKRGVVLGPLLQTGAHQLSAEAVAEGRADFAALDAHTWHLLKRNTALGKKLTVVARTAPTPALPYITSQAQDPTVIRAALAEALTQLSTQDRDALGIKSLVSISSQTYRAVESPEAPQV